MAFPIRFRSAALALPLLTALTACGGGGGGGGADVTTGTLIDGAVSGISYTTPSTSGTTNSNGQFNCKPGETVTFFIGSLQLGTATCQSVVTPVDLTGGGIDDVAVLNMARFFQSLDEDGNAENGLDIPASIAEFLAEGSIDFSLDPTQFAQQAAVRNLLSRVAGMSQLRDSCFAELHLKNSLIQAGVLPRDTQLPVCNSVEGAIKVAGGLQQTLATGSVAVNFQTTLLLDNFIFGVDGRAEVYVDGVYYGLIDSPTLSLALTPGFHEISLRLVDLAGNPINGEAEDTLTVEVADGQEVSVALADDVLFLKPYQLFELYPSGVNLRDGETVEAQLGGQTITLQAYNGVLMGVAPNLAAGSQLLELTLAEQPLSLSIDYVRNDSLDARAGITAILNAMQAELEQFALTLDPVADEAQIAALNDTVLALAAQIEALPTLSDEDAYDLYLYLDANMAGSSLLPRSIASTYECAPIGKMMGAALRFATLTTLTVALVQGVPTALAFGLPGVVLAGLGAGTAYYTFSQSVVEIEKFHTAVHQSIDCLSADTDTLQEPEVINIRSLYRIRNTSGMILVQDGVAKNFVVKTSYSTSDPQYLDAIRKYSRTLGLLQGVKDKLPASLAAAISAAQVDLLNREETSDPLNYQVVITSGTDVSVTTSSNAGQLVLEFAATAEQDFTFNLVNTAKGITTPYGAHITVEQPVANSAVLEVVVGGNGNGTLTSTDPEASYEIVAQPTRGSLTLDGATGEFTYFSNSWTSAPTVDSFSFRALSARDVPSEPATVTVNIAAIPEAPDLTGAVIKGSANGTWSGVDSEGKLLVTAYTGQSITINAIVESPTEQLSTENLHFVWKLDQVEVSSGYGLDSYTMPATSEVRQHTITVEVSNNRITEFGHMLVYVLTDTREGILYEKGGACDTILGVDAVSGVEVLAYQLCYQAEAPTLPSSWYNTYRTYHWDDVIGSFYIVTGRWYETYYKPDGEWDDRLFFREWYENGAIKDYVDDPDGTLSGAVPGIRISCDENGLLTDIGTANEFANPWYDPDYYVYYPAIWSTVTLSCPVQ